MTMTLEAVQTAFLSQEKEVKRVEDALRMWKDSIMLNEPSLDEIDFWSEFEMEFESMMDDHDMQLSIALNYDVFGDDE